jgi:hypothetical protein
MLSAGRNRTGLTERQIEYCVWLWATLGGRRMAALDTSEASRHSTRTRFDERRNTVLLGADVYPGVGVDANSRMTVPACLAHELAHAERFALGYRRPTDLPDVLLDEAETDLRAAFRLVISPAEREALVEDARPAHRMATATAPRRDGAMKVEPTGVVFIAVCSVQTPECTATTPGPVTAVWGTPASRSTCVRRCRP